jgi:hypothetical protein
MTIYFVLMQYGNEWINIADFFDEQSAINYANNQNCTTKITTKII